MTTPLGKRFSKMLRAYYFGCDHPTKLRLWGLLRKLQQHRSLTLPYCGDGWLALDERDLVQRHVLQEGFYEPEVWEALFACGVNAEVVWDIGAHIGTFTVRSLLDPRVKSVHAFEPDPVTFERLKWNVALNSHRPSRCQIHQCAVGGQEGQVTIYRGPVHNTGLSSISAQPTSEAYRVRCRPLDEMVFDEGLEPPTLMKIDVEGFEEILLSGGGRLLRERPPKAIAIEARADENGAVLDQSLVRMLRSFQFELKWIRRPSGIVYARENYLAVPLNQ